MVVPHRTFTDGGLAGPSDNGELFGARDVIVGSLGTNNAETCCNYNMLKLSRGLFFHTADPKYMQYYERALYGQILASRRNVDSATDPLLTYFIPMRPGASRSYGNLGTCCGGTGLESHTKFQDSIYFRSADDSTLYVNLYMASVLSWPEKGFTIKQSTDYPTDPTGTTTLTVEGSGRLTVKLRVPYWVEKGFTVRVNGDRAEAQRQTRRLRHAQPALEPRRQDQDIDAVHPARREGTGHPDHPEHRLRPRSTGRREQRDHLPGILPLQGLHPVRGPHGRDHVHRADELHDERSAAGSPSTSTTPTATTPTSIASSRRSSSGRWTPVCRTTGETTR